jgi:hypothetical protein
MSVSDGSASEPLKGPEGDWLALSLIALVSLTFSSCEDNSQL